MMSTSLPRARRPHLDFGTLILVAGLVAPSFTSAAGPSCTLRGLTQNCRFFNAQSDKEEFTLPDGSSFKNPAYRRNRPPAFRNLDQIVAPRKNLADFADKTVDLQNRLFAAWDGLPPAQKVSDEFKVMFNTMMGTNGKLVDWAEGKSAKNGDSESFGLPWPPQAPDAPVRLVSHKELSGYLDKLPAGTQKKLRALVLENRNLIREFDMPAQVKPTPVTKKSPPTAAQTKRVSSSFAFAKNALLEEISRGRNFASLSAEEKGFYKKIESVRLAPLSKGEKDPDCLKNGGAYYLPAQHEVIVCPDFHNAPASTLALVFGHELSHPIDACRSRSNLWSVNQAKVKQPRTKTGNDELDSAIKELGEAGSHHLPVHPTSRDLESLEKSLRGLGLIEVAAERVKSDDTDPLRPMMTCLGQRMSLRQLSDEQLRAIGSKEAQPFEKMKTHRHCPEISMSVTSEYSEATSDAWGAKVLGRWLTENPPASPLEKIAAVQYLAGPACASSSKANKPDSTKAHSEDEERINSIYLTEARVQKAFGCDGKSEPDCLAMIGTSGPLPDKTRANPTPKENPRIQR